MVLNPFLVENHHGWVSNLLKMGWKNSRDNSPKEKIKIGFSKEMKISVVEISFNLFYIHRAYATKNNLIKLFTHFTFLNEIFFHFR